MGREVLVYNDPPRTSPPSERAREYSQPPAGRASERGLPAHTRNRDNDGSHSGRHRDSGRTGDFRARDELSFQADRPRDRGRKSGGRSRDDSGSHASRYHDSSRTVHLHTRDDTNRQRDTVKFVDHWPRKRRKLIRPATPRRGSGRVATARRPSARPPCTRFIPQPHARKRTGTARPRRTLRVREVDDRPPYRDPFNEPDDRRRPSQLPFGRDEPDPVDRYTHDGTAMADQVRRRAREPRLRLQLWSREASLGDGRSPTVG